MSYLIITIFMTFLLNIQNAEAKPYFALGYGLGSYQDEKKTDIGFLAKGSPAKLTLGARSGHVEIETFARFGTYTGDFTHDGTKNSIERTEKSFGFGLGLYVLPSLRLNFGYSFHLIKESLEKTVSDIESQEIADQYDLQDGMFSGPYIGADFHLFTLGRIKFVISGTAYFMSGNGGKSYEGMLNLKIPFNGFNLNTSRSYSDR